MSVRMRQYVERQIIQAAVESLLAEGFTMRVHDGEQRSAMFATLPEIMQAMFSTDDDTLIVYRNGRQFGWIKLVYGNDGHDVIHDYTNNLDTLLARANTLADYWDGDGAFYPPPYSFPA